jgi:glycosyltransferase involved in cell wall biosynthesis
VSFSVDSLSIVIPCFNEEEAIPEVLPRIVNCLDELRFKKTISTYELIVVNDQSTDRSVELIEKYPEVTLVHTEGVERGYGKALKTGFQKACGEWIGFFDMDNSYRPEDIPLFIEAIKQKRSTFVMGQRPYTDHGMSLVRGTGNWIYVVLARLLYQSHLSDVCSGFRFFHRKHLHEVLSISQQGLDFSIHLTLRFLKSETNIHPVEIQYDPRIGDSKLSVVSDGWSFLKPFLSAQYKVHGEIKHSHL